MKETRKQITLPDGGKCWIRKLSNMDRMRVGIPPAIVFKREEERRKFAKYQPKAEEITEEEIEYGIKTVKTALLNCCSPITYIEGSKVTQLKIVDKTFHERADNEISIDEMEQEVADFIYSEVIKFSGMDQESAKQAESFPETQTVSCESAPDSQNVRGTTIDTSGNADR